MPLQTDTPRALQHLAEHATTLLADESRAKVREEMYVAKAHCVFESSHDAV